MSRRLWILGVFVVLAATASGAWFYAQGRGSTPRFRTAKIERGPLTATVSATGTLNAVVTVQVGSQVSGQIKELFADFNSQVKRNQLVARIDPEIFQARVAQFKAQVEAAKASVLNQRAAVEKARADVANAQAAAAVAKAQTAKAQVAVLDSRRDLGRKRDLKQKGFIAQADEDSAQAAYDSAVAQAESTKAQEDAQASMIRSAQAQLRVAEAMLRRRWPMSASRRPPSSRPRSTSTTPRSGRLSTAWWSRARSTSDRPWRRASRLQRSSPSPRT